MAPPKKRSSSGNKGKKGSSSLLNQPAVGKVPDTSGWDAKVTMSDSVQQQRNSERAKKAAATKKKEREQLKKMIDDIYKDVEDLRSERPVKKRPLAGAALKAQQDRQKREAEKAADEEKAKLAREIQEQAEKEIREKLEDEKKSRDHYLNVRDATRQARHNLRLKVQQLNKRRAAEGSADVTGESLTAGNIEDVDELMAEGEAAGSPSPSSATTSQRAFRNPMGVMRALAMKAKATYQAPGKWYKPDLDPTGVPQKGFYYDENGDLWKDGKRITGTWKGTSKLATDYSSAQQDAISKPTGAPSARKATLDQLSGLTKLEGGKVMEMRTQQGKRAMFQVNLVDRQGKPMDVVFEREVSELEKLSALQMAQGDWEKQNERKKEERKRKKGLDESRASDYLKVPGVVKAAGQAFLKPAKTMLGELKNLAVGILEIAGLFTALYAVKKAADNAEPILNGIKKGFLEAEKLFFFLQKIGAEVTFQSDKAKSLQDKMDTIDKEIGDIDSGAANTGKTGVTTGSADISLGLAGAAGLYGTYKVGKTALGVGKAVSTIGKAVTGLGRGAGTAAGAGAEGSGVAGGLEIGGATVGGVATAGVVSALWSSSLNSGESEDLAKWRASQGSMTKGIDRASLMKQDAGMLAAQLQATQDPAMRADISWALAAKSFDSQASTSDIQAKAKEIDKKYPYDARAVIAGGGQQTGKKGGSASEVIGYLVSKGVPQVAAEGIAANIGQESSFNPQNFNLAGGGSGALGLGQWRGSRQRNLLDFLKSRGKTFQTSTVQDQLDFMLSEQDFSSTKTDLYKAGSPQEAAEIFMREYERPSMNAADLRARQSKAGLYSQQYAQMTRGTVPVGKYEDPGMLRQMAANAGGGNTAYSAPVRNPSMSPAPSNWQQMPGLHSEYLDNIPMLVLNGGALSS